jgi:hypothetical protein
VGNRPTHTSLLIQGVGLEVPDYIARFSLSHLVEFVCFCLFPQGNLELIGELVLLHVAFMISRTIDTTSMTFTIPTPVGFLCLGIKFLKTVLAAV